MLTTRNLYLFGTALLTTASAIEGGPTAALVTAGIAIMIYAFGVAIRDQIDSI
jgi:hypothetical protein